jgi:Zn-dependent peptidase ImmA (M78 family)
MNKITLIILTLFLVNCGYKSPLPFYDTHKDMEKYITYFENLTGIPVYGVPVNYGNTGYYLGVCKSDGYVKWVVINKSFFKSASDSSRLVLILHELGHCILNKGHNNQNLNEECPYSIMNESHIGSYCFEKYESHYLWEYLN